MLSVVNTLVSMHHLVGVHEIAEMLGVTRQRVDRIVATDESFPRPEAVLAAGRIWKRADIESWAERREVRRKPRKRASS
jgi:predicted DNA-binding transcriptional regulator AlpA